MAKINSNPISGATNSFRWSSRIAKVFIELRKDGVSSDDLLSSLKDVKFQVDKSTQSGTEVKIYPTSLKTLFEICTHFSGAIIGEKVGTTAFNGATINLTMGGAEQMQKDEYYNIQITGLPDGVTADLYAVDDSNDTLTLLAFTPIDVPENAPKYVTLTDAVFLAVPYGKLRSIEITHQNKRVVRYEPDEFEHVCKLNNPMTSNMEGKLTTGPIDFFVYPVVDAVEVKLDMIEDSKVILVNRSYN